jgi:hypothetical protein
LSMRNPCQRCGEMFNPENNSSKSCSFHASDMQHICGTTGAFVFGKWTCCGATWEGAPSCNSRPHLSKERVVIARIESLPKQYLNAREVSIYRHLELTFYPGVRYELNLQVTKEISRLFMAYFMGEGGEKGKGDNNADDGNGDGSKSKKSGSTAAAKNVVGAVNKTAKEMTGAVNKTASAAAQRLLGAVGSATGMHEKKKGMLFGTAPEKDNESGGIVGAGTASIGGKDGGGSGGVTKGKRVFSLQRFKKGAAAKKEELGGEKGGSPVKVNLAKELKANKDKKDARVAVGVVAIAAAAAANEKSSDKTNKKQDKKNKKNATNASSKGNTNNGVALLIKGDEGVGGVGGKNNNAPPAARKEDTEIVFIKYWRFGEVNAKISLSGFSWVDTNHFGMKIPPFVRSKKVGTWKYLLGKYFHHVLWEVSKSTASSGLSKVKQRMHIGNIGFSKKKEVQIPAFSLLGSALLENHTQTTAATRGAIVRQNSGNGGGGGGGGGDNINTATAAAAAATVATAAVDNSSSNSGNSSSITKAKQKTGVLHALKSGFNSRKSNGDGLGGGGGDKQQFKERDGGGTGSKSPKLGFGGLGGGGSNTSPMIIAAAAVGGATPLLSLDSFDLAAERKKKAKNKNGDGGAASSEIAETELSLLRSRSSLARSTSTRTEMILGDAARTKKKHWWSKKK